MANDTKLLVVLYKQLLRLIAAARRFARRQVSLSLRRLRRAWPVGTADSSALRPMKEVFTEIYAGNIWGSKISHSGPGSDLIQTAVIRATLPDLIVELGVGTMLDVPCGDFYWMRHVKTDVDYTGIDVVADLVRANNDKYGGPRRRFLKLDVSRDDLPMADLIFCRDLLVHFSFEDARRTVANLKRSRSKWLLTTTFTGRTENLDIPTGHWRPLNLVLSPFNFPAPHRLVNEACTEGGNEFADKSLGLWHLSDL